MNYYGDLRIDHKNGDLLDNRVENLRISTPEQNAMNRKICRNNNSGVTGVGLVKSGRYRARITVNKKEMNLGTFKTKEEAIKARKDAEVKYFGEWARET
jgi:HNH endonuclease